MYGTNVVVVNNQSRNNEKILLFADWLFTTTTFVPHMFFQAVSVTLTRFIQMWREFTINVMNEGMNLPVSMLRCAETRQMFRQLLLVVPSSFALSGTDGNMDEESASDSFGSMNR